MRTVKNGRRRLLPVLAAATALVALPAPAGAVRAAPCRNADLVPNRANLPLVRSATLCLVNRQRRLHKRSPLRANDDLGKAARAYVARMAQDGFFSHVSPDGSTPLSRIRVTLYLVDAHRWALGENLAWGGGDAATPRQMVAAWMHSPSHRRNMLSARFRQLGVGIAVGTPTHGGEPGATYATEFGVRVKR